MNNKLLPFTTVFQITKTIIFEVRYTRVGNNKDRDFATSCAEFIRSKRSYSRCGQCQGELLSGAARVFWERWDGLHLNPLTENQYITLIKDINNLKSIYNSITINSDRLISFSEEVELSKMELKSKQK